MTSTPFTVRVEQPGDAARVEALNEAAFGPGRFSRSAYRLREGVAHDPELSLVAEAGGELVSSVRMTPITIGGRPAILLGPLVVDPPWKGRGAGRMLVRAALDAAREHGHSVVLLVGDEPYYGPLGFQRPEGRITLPGPADPARVLVAGLREGALDGLAGAAERVAGA